MEAFGFYTPFYMIDESLVERNMQKVAYLEKISGVKCVLALKCFSTWSLFPLLSKYMHGTTSSSLYEAKLGYEKFGKETHAYSVAYDENDVKELVQFSDKIIFNSVSQYTQFKDLCTDIQVGLRVNPKVSFSDFDLADPNRPYSRLGIQNHDELDDVIDSIDGLMLHYNCENGDMSTFKAMLTSIEQNLGSYFKKVKWISLGGGVEFTKESFDLVAFGKLLADFSCKYDVEVYLEPGEAAITGTTQLVTSVLDIVENEKQIAIVNSSIEAHMLDLLIYRESAKIECTGDNYHYQIAGNSCLAGDIFGKATFSKKLQIGDTVVINDAAGYTMVKKNWFNGVKMPSIVIKGLDGALKLVKEFDYNDFINNLS